MQPAPTQHIYRHVQDELALSKLNQEEKRTEAKSLARSTTAIAMSTMSRREVRRRSSSKSCNGRRRRGEDGVLRE
jgi:hypothetical protein